MARYANSLALALAVASTAPVRADSASAQASFERGRELLKNGDTRAACAAFEASLKDEFQYGTLYNLAGCQDKLGNLASAWRMYTRLSAEDTNPGRRERSRELAQKLWGRVPKLIVDVADPPAGVAVRLDGEDILARLNQAIAVDPGEHVVLAIAPGYREWRTTANVEPASAEVRVAIALDRDDAPIAEPAQPAVTQYRRRRVGHRTAAYWFAAGGLAGFVISGGIGYYYKLQHDAALGGLGREYETLEEVYAAANHAHRMNRWVATPIFLAGVASLSVGVVLYVKSNTIVLTPIATSGGGGAALTGSF